MLNIHAYFYKAVLQHDEPQWEKWVKRQAKKGIVDSIKAQSDDGGVGSRIRRRDLTRVLRLEMALMWNRIEVVKQEVSQYTVLPGLATMSLRLTFMVTGAGAGKYVTISNNDLVLKTGDQVDLIRMRGAGLWWLVRHPKSKEMLWMLGQNLSRDVSKSSFGDSVTLAHIQMLT